MVTFRKIVWSVLIGSLLGWGALAMEGEGNADGGEGLQQQQQQPPQQHQEGEKQPVVEQHLQGGEKHKDVEQVLGDGAAKKQEPQPTALTQSIIGLASTDIEASYIATNEDVSGPKAEARIYYLTTKNNPRTWKSLVNLGFLRKGFTPRDVMWTVKEFAEPYTLSKENAKALFGLMITSQFDGNNREAIIGLLTDVSLTEEDGVYNTWVGTTKGAKYSVIGKIVELGHKTNRYLDALDAILKLLPIEQVNKALVVTREEYTGKGDGYLDWQYKSESYTLLAWLTRVYSDVHSAYLDKAYYRRDYYVEAAKRFIDRSLANKPAQGEKDVSVELYNMMLLLNKQTDIDVSLVHKAANRLIMVDTVSEAH